MPKSLFMLCSEGAVIDQATNNLTVFNIIEEMAPDKNIKFPFIFPRIVCILNLEKSKSDPEIISCDLKIKIDNEQINNFDVKLDFKGKKRSRLIVTINGLNISKTGIMRFALFCKEKELDHYNIAIATNVHSVNM